MPTLRSECTRCVCLSLARTQLIDDLEYRYIQYATKNVIKKIVCVPRTTNNNNKTRKKKKHYSWNSAGLYAVYWTHDKVHRKTARSKKTPKQYLHGSICMLTAAVFCLPCTSIVNMIFFVYTFNVRFVWCVFFFVCTSNFLLCFAFRRFSFCIRL